MKEIDTFFMSDKQIEEMKRKRKWNKKMSKVGKLFLVGVASMLVFGFVPDILLSMGLPIYIADLVSAVSLSTSSLSVLAGVCKFARTLHDPLTSKEAEELAEKDAIEKGGVKK